MNDFADKLLNISIGLVMVLATTILTLEVFFIDIEDYIVGKEPQVVSYNLHGTVNLKMAHDFKNFITQYGAGDRVNIHIESEGGLTVSQYKIVHYMLQSKAHLHCEVDSHASSSAANILMNCNTVNVTPHARILFHMSRRCVKFEDKKCIETKIASPAYQPDQYHLAIHHMQPIKQYLTDDEWAGILNGDDFIIYGQELMRRIIRGPK